MKKKYIAFFTALILAVSMVGIIFAGCGGDDLPPNALASIRVVTAPTKTAYVEGEFFESSGMVVEAVNNDGRSYVIEGYEVTPATVSYGDTSVTVGYQGKTTTQAITVAYSATSVVFSGTSGGNTATITLRAGGFATALVKGSGGAEVYNEEGTWFQSGSKVEISIDKVTFKADSAVATGFSFTYSGSSIAVTPSTNNLVPDICFTGVGEINNFPVWPNGELYLRPDGSFNLYGGLATGGSSTINPLVGTWKKQGALVEITAYELEVNEDGSPVMADGAYVFVKNGDGSNKVLRVITPEFNEGMYSFEYSFPYHTFNALAVMRWNSIGKLVRFDKGNIPEAISASNSVRTTALNPRWIASGDTIEPSSSFVQATWNTDYRIKEWRSGSATGAVLTVPHTVTSDVTMYAMWRDAVEYTLTVDTQSGTAIAPITRKEDTNITATMLATTRENYVLSGWRVGSATGEAISVPFRLTKDTTVYAVWEPGYTVSFNLGNSLATGPSSVAVLAGQALQESQVNATLLGHTVKNWRVGSLTGDIVAFPYTPTAGVTLYAEWEKDTENPAAVFASTSESNQPGIIVLNKDGTSKLLGATPLGFNLDNEGTWSYNEDTSAFSVDLFGDGELVVTSTKSGNVYTINFSYTMYMTWSYIMTYSGPAPV